MCMRPIIVGFNARFERHRAAPTRERPLGGSEPHEVAERADYFAKRSRSFIFQNLPVDVRGTASMNS